MKPYLHANISAKKYGGKPEDYLFLHDWVDSSKVSYAGLGHRAILHSTFGCFLAEEVHGHTFKNSDGKDVSVRDVVEEQTKEKVTPQEFDKAKTLLSDDLEGRGDLTGRA